jgi:hypothetical protein
MIRFLASALTCAAIFIACPAFALPTGARLLSASDMFQTNHSGKTYTCGRINSAWHGGQLVSGRFISFAQLIKNTKSAVKRAKGSKRTKLQSKLTSYKSSHSTVGAICRAAADNSNIPPPVSTPRPTPTPNLYFDSAGNVTAAGKSAFAIPSSLSANKDSGLSVWNNECRVCHESEHRNKRYSELVNLITEDPMYVSIPNSQLANLVAYLNRFR